MKLAQRMVGIGTETAFEAAGKARAWEAQGHDVIHLEVGEPDFDTPVNIRNAAKKALDDGFTHYPPPLGLPVLREAIAKDSTARRGFQVEPGNVVVTPGAKPVMFYALLALIDAGDEVIYPDPGFPIYESMTRYAGGTPVPLRLDENNDFRFDPDELRSLVTPKTKLIIFNSPHNPTGGVLTLQDLEAIADVAREHDIVVMADEIYGRLVYQGEHHSIARLPGMAERTIVLDGFSKSYAMTGWRMGYAIVPPTLVDAYSKLIINSVSGTSAFQQVAAAEAINGPQDSVDAMAAEFRARRDLVVEGLNKIPGVRCRMPSGAFYAFPNISGTGMTGSILAEKLLYEANVCVLSGTAFGKVCPDHIRISYANSQPNLRRALERFEELVSKVPTPA
ncbi:MAG TPA: pyridoxal phosphate-dependent aminotransferase [Candidatus Limnocylindria bacterium]|nr:pyridoxal phosphate-dependent aminotransferase [Candidatus Limnocylindria bacterium]